MDLKTISIMIKNTILKNRLGTTIIIPLDMIKHNIIITIIMITNTVITITNTPTSNIIITNTTATTF